VNTTSWAPSCWHDENLFSQSDLGLFWTPFQYDLFFHIANNFSLVANTNSKPPRWFRCSNAFVAFFESCRDARVDVSHGPNHYWLESDASTYFAECGRRLVEGDGKVRCMFEQRYRERKTSDAAANNGERQLILSIWWRISHRGEDKKNYVV
jgi:hypothetical protein